MNGTIEEYGILPFACPPPKRPSPSHTSCTPAGTATCAHFLDARLAKSWNTSILNIRSKRCMYCQSRGTKIFARSKRGSQVPTTRQMPAHKYCHVAVTDLDESTTLRCICSISRATFTGRGTNYSQCEVKTDEGCYKTITSDLAFVPSS